MTLRNSGRRYRKVILKADADVSALVSPDFWPGDEVWDDKYRLLGVIDSTGRFQAAPSACWD